MKHYTELWIDATDFESAGGWKLDTQFVHLMGTPYITCLRYFGAIQYGTCNSIAYVLNY